MKDFVEALWMGITDNFRLWTKYPIGIPTFVVCSIVSIILIPFIILMYGITIPFDWVWGKVWTNGIRRLFFKDEK